MTNKINAIQLNYNPNLNIRRASQKEVRLIIMKNDYQGKQFIAVHDVRGAIVSAQATLTTGTATTLLAGDTDYNLDAIEIFASNNSTASVNVIITSDGTTLRTLQIPASDTKQFKFDVPLRQVTKGTPWQADMEDVTGTTVTLDCEFIKVI